MNEKPKELKDELPEDEPLVGDPIGEPADGSVNHDDDSQSAGQQVGDEPTVEPADEETKEPEPSEDEPEPEPWPPFKNMPGVKKPESPTVKERVPQFRSKVLKLYKRMKRGERLTEKQFAKRLKLKDPKDIQAAGIAWHFLFDEKLIPDTQFYKPLVRK